MPPERRDDTMNAMQNIERDVDAAYHVFSAAHKRQLTMLVSVSGLFLSLSGSIYLPALVAISKAMQVDTPLVFLSVTVYMVVQSFASAMLGPLSDALGRRCVFLAALVAYGASNVGLALSTRYSELMGFRALQAAGTAVVMSVGAGVVADYTDPGERASHLGVLGAARLLGQSFAPVLGGLLEQNFGFRSIFYFLLALGLVSLFLLLVFLPETNRAIAGDGTVTLGSIFHRPLMYAVTGQPHVSPSSTSFSSSLSSPRPKRHQAPSLPMLGLGEKDILATVIFAGVIMAVWTAVSCTTGLVLQAQFGLTDLQVGLCFLPGGAGGALASCLAGWALSGPCSLPTTTRNRLRHAPLAVILFVACVASYGWAAHPSAQHLPEAAVLGPLALQFLASMAQGAVSTQSGTLVTDLFPQGAGGSAAAAGVLVRGLAGAAAVAGVTYALAVQQAGFVFVEFSAVGAMISGALLCMLWAWGGEWRGDRERRRLQKNRASLEDARRVAHRHHGE